MNDPEYDVHPLDRDYSLPEPKAKRLPKLPDGPIHRVGLIIFAVGFVTLILTAILLGTVRRAGWLETIGSYAHQFGMVMILVGGILILIGLRVRSLSLQGAEKAVSKLGNFRTFGILLVVNIVAHPLFQTVLTSLRTTYSPQFVGLFYVVTITVAAGLMATIAVLHRGALRGFAIGFLVAMLMGSMTGFSYGGYGSFSGYAYAVPQRPALMLMYPLLIVQSTAMICAGYAAIVDRPEASKR